MINIINTCEKTICQVKPKFQKFKIIMKSIVKFAFHIKKDKSLRFYQRTTIILWSKTKHGKSTYCTKKIKVFHQRFLQQIWPNLQFPADLVNFTEEILKRKLQFFCSNLWACKYIWTNIHLIYRLIFSIIICKCTIRENMKI